MAVLKVNVSNDCGGVPTTQAAVSTFRELLARNGLLRVAVKCRDNADRMRLAEHLKGIGGTYHPGQCCAKFPGGARVWISTAQAPGSGLEGLRLDVLVGLPYYAASMLDAHGLRLQVTEEQAAEFWGMAKPDGDLPAYITVDGQSFSGIGRLTNGGARFRCSQVRDASSAIKTLRTNQRATVTIGGVTTVVGMIANCIMIRDGNGVRFDMQVMQEAALMFGVGTQAAAVAFCSFVTGLKAWAVSPVGLRRARESELAAIVNGVPEWAHPVAWGAAVLAVAEYGQTGPCATPWSTKEAWQKYAIQPALRRHVESREAQWDGMVEIQHLAVSAYGRALAKPAKVAPERKRRGPVVAIQGDWEDD
jgi:hypothetical protein